MKNGNLFFFQEPRLLKRNNDIYFAFFDKLFIFQKKILMIENIFLIIDIRLLFFRAL